MSVVTLPVGYYNAGQLGHLLTAYLDAANMGSSYDAPRNTLQLDYKGGSVGWYMPSDAELATGQWAFPDGCTSDNPKSLNTLLRNYNDGVSSTWLNGHNSYRINFLSVSPYDYVFLRSKALASQNSISTRGQHDVIAMIPCNAAFAEILTGGTPLSEALDIHANTFNTLDFQLTDRFSRAVDQQADVCFQLTFFN